VNFIIEVKEEIKEQCSIYLKQVERFLENYLCSSNSKFCFFCQNLIAKKNFIWIVNHIETSSTSTKIDLNIPLDWSKLDETLQKISTTSSQINYFDDDENFNFINLNKNLLNTTEQTVYIVCQLIFWIWKIYSFFFCWF